MAIFSLCFYGNLTPGEFFTGVLLGYNVTQEDDSFKEGLQRILYQENLNCTYAEQQNIAKNIKNVTPPIPKSVAA